MLKKQTYFIFVSLLFLFYYPDFAASKEIKFDVITTREGVSQNSITCILQDAEGYMWFGTRNGLNLYDGYSFSSFFSDDSANTLSDNHITSIMEDHLGVLWVGTANGLNKINKYHQEFKHYHADDKNESLSGNFINYVYQDQMTNIWVATQNGLSKLIKHRNVFQNYPFEGKINQIISLHGKDKNHILLLATSKGIHYVDMQTETIQAYPLNQTLSQATCFYKQDDGLYIGTRDKGVFYLDITNNKLKKVYQNNKRNFPITGIESLNNQELIITTRGNGFYRHNIKKNQTVHYSARDRSLSNISDNSILSLHKGKEKVFWIGTELGGIHKYSAVKSSHIFKQNLKNFVFNDIAINYKEKDRIWLATDYQGIINYDVKNKTFELHDQISLESSIYTIYNIPETPEKILLGTQYNGLYSYNTRTKNINPVAAEKLNGKKIISIQQGLTKDILVFTEQSGIHRFNNQLHYIEQISLHKSVSIVSASKDYLGFFWLGMDDQSLSVLRFSSSDDTYKLINKKELSGLIKHDVISVFRDIDEIIWIGTKGGGAFRYSENNPGQIDCFTQHNGLADNTVYAFAEDNSGNVWIFSSSGVNKLNKPTLNITSYVLQDFILTNPSIRRPLKIDETLYIGQTNGLHYFSPDILADKKNTHIPPIVIRKISIIKEKTDVLENFIADFFTNELPVLELDYHKNSFEIEFAALDYAEPEKNQYKFKLIGYDDDYTQTNADNRIARYYNVKPGEYVFHVIGSNNDNIWNEKGTSLTIIVEKPFWMSWWFICCSGIFITLILLFTYKTFRRTIKNKDEIRNLTLAQETLFLKENQLKTLIDNLPDFIYIKDTDSNFILANQKLANVMGVNNPDELIGKNDHGFYPKELADQYMMDEMNVIKHKRSLINRIEPGKDEYGNAIIVSTSKVPVINNKGNVIGIVGIGRDITEIKKAEEKIKEQSENLQETNMLLEERQEEIVQQKEEIEYQRDELEKLNKTKDKFFSIIGHDLKNPFHAIIALSEMIIQDYNNLDDHEKIEMLSMIKGSSENAFNLLENLLEWAKSQTENIEFYPENISLKQIIEETFSVLQINAERKNISVTIDIQTNVILYADKNMLKTIIRNLINNAIKFTHKDGEINIHSKEENNKVFISIQDNGIGMNETIKSQLFSLEKLHSKNGTLGESGTGLGLILCKEFIQKHNGELFIESEENKGSKFVIVLPTAKEK